jgi:hypothetical protein
VCRPAYGCCVAVPCTADYISKFWSESKLHQKNTLTCYDGEGWPKIVQMHKRRKRKKRACNRPTDLKAPPFLLDSNSVHQNTFHVTTSIRRFKCSAPVAICNVAFGIWYPCPVLYLPRRSSAMLMCLGIENSVQSIRFLKVQSEN